MMRIALLLSLVITLAAPAWAGEAANANLDVLRDTIRANRKALVAVNLRLTDAEAKDFWPVYDRYEKDLKEVNDRLVQVLDDYSSHFKDLSDEQAKKLLDDYLAVEEDRAKLRRTYVADFGKTLPGKKVARFYQIENKMDAVIRYDLAATIPVVE
jgi:hypothetical protein